jgi:hypothetical protein
MRYVVAAVLAIASAASAQPAKRPIFIGVEYAYPGGGETFARLGVPAVKLYPDSITWGDMQPIAGGPIDFSKMDRFVSEYQKAGFTDLVLVLKSTSRWASKNVLLNLTPWPQFLDAYENWVREVVKRYSGDGKNDMPGLKHPVRLFEVGSEFSTFEPEAAEEYIPMLQRAYRGAHSASNKVVVLHAAFLTPTVFRSHPKPEKYAPEFARVEERVKMHGLDGMRKVLDAHKHFDMVNFHALSDPIEIEDTVAWLRYEMRQRKFDKPIMISDTMPNPLIGWGPATRMPPPTVFEGPNYKAVGIMIHPATEDDRPALNDYFNRLINGDKAATDWNHAFAAADMIKKVAIAADQGVVLINTAFMEDLAPFKTRAFQAGAGTSAWAGMVETEMNVLTQERRIKSLRPAFYAIQQMQRNIKAYQTVERVKTYNAKIRMYKFAKGDFAAWVAWYDPGKLFLPNTKLPSLKFKFEVSAETLTVEKMIDKPGQTKAETTSVAVKDGKAELTLTPWPVFVLKKE